MNACFASKPVAGFVSVDVDLYPLLLEECSHLLAALSFLVELVSSWVVKEVGEGRVMEGRNLLGHGMTLRCHVDVDSLALSSCHSSHPCPEQVIKGAASPRVVDTICRLGP